MSSTRDSAGESLRRSCNDFARSLARIPVSVIEGISRAMSRRAPRRNPQNWQIQQRPGRLPIVPEELFFFNTFEAQYGSYHPFFYGCRFTEALRIADREGKLVFVYLHAPEHPYTEPFCQRTLSSDVVVEFLDANFVSWGAVCTRGEGMDIAASLQAGSFPFCAIVAPASDDSIVVLQQVEGPVSPSQLVEILQRTIDEQGSAFKSSRAEEEERRRSTLQLRQEQDAAYLESLRKDQVSMPECTYPIDISCITIIWLQEKEKAQKRLQERVAIPAEKQAANNQQRQKQPVRRTKGAPKRTESKETTWKETITSQRAEATTKIMIRFPNGERRQQNFHHMDTIREIYKYIDSLGIPGIANYQLVSSYPRKIYGHQQLGMTLRDAGFHPSTVLYLEQLK